MAKRKRKTTSHGTGIPPGAVFANPRQQVPNNSYCPAPTYYEDIEFKCIDCGKREVWLAKDQKWYYEVAKGPLYATAVRCQECRYKRKHSGKSDSGN
ncbi:zinc-ribbon domain containing protein [Aeoliella sp.]|uniref:zinc-ribbon domain containing protein n=1 Tax=Aeoliella sp. TaxID=2795800 RepID=UPI003CCC4425